MLEQLKARGLHHQDIVTNESLRKTMVVTAYSLAEDQFDPVLSSEAKRFRNECLKKIKAAGPNTFEVLKLMVRLASDDIFKQDIEKELRAEKERMELLGFEDKLALTRAVFYGGPGGQPSDPTAGASNENSSTTAQRTSTAQRTAQRRYEMTGGSNQNPNMPSTSSSSSTPFNPDPRNQQPNTNAGGAAIMNISRCQANWG